MLLGDLLARFDEYVEGQVLADLYVCWRCRDHHVAVEPEGEPPEYHTCGYGPLEWSGHLMAYDPESRKFWRTWDEMPTKVIQQPAPGTQLELPQTAYEYVGP